MLRVLLALAVVTAALPLGSHPARAGDEFPWCAVISLGNETVHWDCRYRTVEECVPNVLAGNRGFCNHNPYWEPPAVRPRAHQRKRRVRAH